MQIRECEVYPPCPVCKGVGTVHSDVCHCGAPMEGHSVYDNHTATEMDMPCDVCDGCGRLMDAVLLGYMESNKVNVMSYLTTEGSLGWSVSSPCKDRRGWVIADSGITLREALYSLIRKREMEK